MTLSGLDAGFLNHVGKDGWWLSVQMGCPTHAICMSGASVLPFRRSRLRFRAAFSGFFVAA
jgi:hypothetical protein